MFVRLYYATIYNTIMHLSI